MRSGRSIHYKLQNACSPDEMCKKKVKPINEQKIMRGTRVA